MVADDTLAAALRRAYAVFGEAGRPRHADACRHCFDEVEVRSLLATPPCELTGEQVLVLRGNLGTTFGGARETRWFAPRLVESLTDGALAGTDEFVGAAIGRAGWPSEWPGDEVQALRALTAAVVASTLRRETEGNRIDSVLASVALFETDLAPYLAAWSALAERERALALLRLLPVVGDALVHGVRRAPWWSEAPQGFAALRSYVLDPERTVEAAGFVEDPELGADCVAARTWLDLLSR